MSDNNIANASASAERLMRAYHKHSLEPDPDTLFALLEAMHSANDRLKKACGIDFIDLPDFLALKCLRNFFHHHDELRHSVRVIPTRDLPIDSDLLFLCLVPRNLIDDAIEQTSVRYKSQSRYACEHRFHWYGNVVNINPCLLNFIVHAYERLTAASIELSGAEAEAFRCSYNFEAASGFSHFVDGRISTTAGNIDQLLSDLIE
ncbi:hypothetical protein [Brucella pituitosa]|uniref:hypothetical protein n=1 Tax=Brucella pituitosa TaxID=571256 RepID=UPI003F4ACE90